MMQLIAQRGDQYLVQTGPETGRILDVRGYGPEMFLQSILARGYWEETDASLEDIERSLSIKWDESKHPRDEEGQFTRVAMTSQRAPGDPGHMSNKDVFRHMRAFHRQLSALPGVSRVSVKPGVGGWEGGSESMWQIYYRGNGEARKLVAETAKKFNQDAVLILNGCQKGQDCQPAVELSFAGGISSTMRDHVQKVLVANGIGGWTWMRREGHTVLRMVCVPQWGGEAKAHQRATATISEQLREDGLKNHRRVHKVAVSVMEREGYDAIIGS